LTNQGLRAKLASFWEGHKAGEPYLMNHWSMKRDRALIQLARANAGVDQIASKLKVAPEAVFKAAKRLGIYLGPQPPERDGRLKASKLAVGNAAGRRSRR
jgi:hypothetical protein